MMEEYRLVLTHYVVDEVTGERFRPEKPIVVTQAFDRRYGGSPIILNRMCDEMKEFVLAMMDDDRKRSEE